MRNKAILNYLSATCVALSLIACEGPAGPTGADGTDANESCIQCHNEASTIKAKTDQYLASVHNTGGTAARSENASCSPCHSHEGFVFNLENDSAKSIAEATQPGCRTCHLIHNNYDSTDWTLRTTDPVEFALNGEVFDKGKGNLCANCHQPRVPSPNPLAVTSDSITITSSRWGVHHGPQSTIMAGTGGYIFPGQSYSFSGHANIEDGCVSCHMSPAYGSLAGGHTMAMSYDDHGDMVLRTDGCLDCHTEEEAIALYETKQHQVDSLQTVLKDLLLTKSFIKSDGSVNASSDTPLKVSLNQARALLNYNLIMEDRSGGVHNPKYTIALLQGAISEVD